MNTNWKETIKAKFIHDLSWINDPKRTDGHELIETVEALLKEQLEEVTKKVEALWGVVNADDKDFYIKRSAVLSLLKAKESNQK